MDYGLLVKFKLSIWVVFSATLAYLTASSGKINWAEVMLLSIGGFLVTGAANALNQVLERDYDKLMPRTANRPVATGRMSVSEAVLAAGLMLLFGMVALCTFNALTGFLGMLSFVAYAFIYTPLKRSTPFAVAVGALPGALPAAIGVTAAGLGLSHLAIWLFAIQFLWQFPHFWSIAWMADDDYKRAGYYLLPSRNGVKDGNTGRLAFIFCLLLIGNVFVGYSLGLIGNSVFALMLFLNILFTVFSIQFWQKGTRESALKLMFFSIIQLPLTQIAVFWDKF